MRVFLGVLLALVCVSVAQAQAETLDCTITQYQGGAYGQAELAGILPVQQRHIIDAGIARKDGVSGEVTRNDAERLKWRYSAIIRRNAGMTATVSYALIRRTGLLVIRIEPGGKMQRDNSIVSQDFRFKVRRIGMGEYMFVPVRRVVGTCMVRP